MDRLTGKEQTQMKICIDAGHGLDTPGKRCPDDSMKEYQFNSAVAKMAIDLLSQYVGVETLKTFSDTLDIPLKQRTDKANAWQADVLVSIHANASGGAWSAVRGIETFVYTTRPAASVALAMAVQKHMIRETGLGDRGVKADDLHMLRESKMPAILCECGFMTNRDEAELLKSDEYRKKCAKSIVGGLVEIYNLKKKNTELKMSSEDAQKVVNILGMVFNLVGTIRTEKISIVQNEVHRLTNEIRTDYGLPRP